MCLRKSIKWKSIFHKNINKEEFYEVQNDFGCSSFGDDDWHRNIFCTEEPDRDSHGRLQEGA
jgi:hypothetical protein